MPGQPQISEELRQQIEALCDRIAGGEPFDPDVRRELVAHLEQKAVSYRIGETLLSDGDIMLLVEKHFGDAADLRARYSTFSARAVSSAVLNSLNRILRRLTALVVAV